LFMSCLNAYLYHWHYYFYAFGVTYILNDEFILFAILIPAASYR
jgi:hypothetical protein